MWALTQPVQYNNYVNDARARYQQTGYYVDPTKGKEETIITTTSPKHS